MDLSKYCIPYDYLCEPILEQIFDYCKGFDLSSIALEGSINSNLEVDKLESRVTKLHKKVKRSISNKDETGINNDLSELKSIASDITKVPYKDDEKIKDRVKKILKVILAIIAALLIAFGLYKAGSAVFTVIKDGNSNKAKRLLNEAKTSDKIIAESSGWSADFLRGACEVIVFILELLLAPINALLSAVSMIITIVGVSIMMLIRGFPKAVGHLTDDINDKTIPLSSKIPKVTKSVALLPVTSLLNGLY